MNYSLTIFKNQYANDTSKTMSFDNWQSFVDLLRALSQKPLAGKRDAPLISPAMYEVGTTRANRNVVDWGHWACVDVDDYEGPLEDIITQFRWNDAVIYSTASSTIDHPKFRVVLNLDRRVATEELRHFWYALNKHLGDIGDAQTKDASRMYYIPADYASSTNNFFHVTEGSPVEVDKLMRNNPYSPPTGNSFLDSLSEEMQAKVIQHRQSKLDNMDITWSGYLDCPFVPNKLVSDYKSIAGEGWYRKLYQIMVAIAGNAIKAKYPITARQIEMLCREIDQETGNWYADRPIQREAESALNYAYAHCYED